MSNQPLTIVTNHESLQYLNISDGKPLLTPDDVALWGD
jgi:hypothetical protein